MDAGTRLLVGDCFTEGADPEAAPFFGKVITFKCFHNDKWVYFEECEHAPFRYDEIVCIAEDVVIDPGKQYDVGDMNLIFGEVIS